jgi:hypothetical protein
MKSHWRKQLQKYSNMDPSAKLLQKTHFPKMLKELLDSLSPGQLLPKAFEKCGIVPVNRQKVLERIPTVLQTEEIARHVDANLLKNLEVRRFGDSGKKKPRGKKVPAGESYSKPVEDEEDDEESEDDEEREEEGEDSLSEMESDHDEQEKDDDLEELELPDLEVPSKKMSGHVVAVYEDEWFLAEVCKDQSGVESGYTKLKYMTIKGMNNFSWGPKEDIHITLDEDIILNEVVPEPVNSRGGLGLAKKDFAKVVSLMVMVYFLFYFNFKFLLHFSQNVWLVEIFKNCSVSFAFKNRP